MPPIRRTTSPASTSGEVVYHCRKCRDGRNYTAEQCDAHRKWHKEYDGRAKRNLRLSDKESDGRAKRNLRSSDRHPSPGPSEFFEEIPSSAETVYVPGKRTGGASTPAGAPTKKHRSNKAFDTGVIGKWIHGKSG